MVLLALPIDKSKHQSGSFQFISWHVTAGGRDLKTMLLQQFQVSFYLGCDRELGEILLCMSHWISLKHVYVERVVNGFKGNKFDGGGTLFLFERRIVHEYSGKELTI